MTAGMGGLEPGALQRKALEAAERIAGDAGNTPAQADEADVAGFQKAMEASGPGEAAPAAEPESPDVSASAPRDVADRILDGMSSASESIQAKRNEAVEVMTKENVTQADLLRANFSMIESSAMVSAISKTTEKITQSVKTLQQG